MKRICLWFLICAALCLFGVVYNADASTVRLQRPKVRLSIPSGSTESGSITVANPSDKNVNVKAYLEDWIYTATQDGIKDFAPPGTTPLSCAKWISFYPAEFTLPPFGSREIFFVVKVPKAVDGGHYAVLFFETVVGSTVDATGVNILIKGRIGSLFYIEAGGVQKEATITDISIAKAGKETAIEAVLNNIGNVDITANGSFNIIDSKGMVFARGKFNEVYTFPGDKATIASAWSAKIPAGEYDLIITLDLGNKPLIYEAKINVNAAGEVRYVAP